VLRTSIVPQAGTFGALKVPGEANDQAFQYHGGFASYTFDDLDLAWTPFDPTNQVGEAFFFTKSSGSVSNLWIRNFTVQ
jgi:hypothetical protein